ncbi:MAG: Ribosomal RNA small subunit methyltransferase A [Alphaproteobacteria bacterium MarineAlpha2_Bin1]|nr:MAG: Ribosomal RNA small subunit methyltransferase A [Alphaproteobacteria bacterium MarineAlpha2_Bin1]
MYKEEINLKYLLNKYNLISKKSLGQHFLFEKNIIYKILEAANIQKNSHVYEVGPGPGSLTIELAKMQPKSITVIEKDERCLNALNEIKSLTKTQINIISGDAVKFNEISLGKENMINISNLPYNISTKLLVKWIENRTPFTKYILMFQREVAERLVSKKNEKTYSRISVLTQWFYEIEKLFNVPNTAFTPKPKVDSTVIMLKPRPKPLYPANIIYLQKVLRVCFGHRRKMLKTSLSFLHSNPEEILNKAGINKSLRPEDLSIKEFCFISNELENSS